MAMRSDHAGIQREGDSVNTEPGVPVRFLIVEDSEDDAALIERELRRGGFFPVCHRVDTAEAMRAALVGEAWDLVMSDHSMPQFSAPAALATLRALGLDIPFV